MKYRKPQYAFTSCINRDSIDIVTGAKQLVDFLRSLPDEFEILGPGEVAVKWPEGLTKSHLKGVSLGISWPPARTAIDALAAIAPEKKKQMRRRVSVLQFQGHGENFGKLELSFNMDPQFPWVKVGECEIEN